MVKTELSVIDRSGIQDFSCRALVIAAVTVALVLLLMPPCSSSAEPQLDWYADEAEATPAPPPAGQGAKGQACAGIITLDKKEVNDNDTISVEILIPALWSDKIDYVKIVEEDVETTAVPMGNGLYVSHFKASAPSWRDYDYSGSSVVFRAYKGNEVVCTGAAYYSVHFLLNVGIRSSASRIQSGDEVTFTAMVSGDRYPPAPPFVYSWNLAGESRQIAKDTPTDIQVKSFSLRGESFISLIVTDAEGRRGWGIGKIDVYKNDLSLTVGGPISLNVGETGMWTVEASRGKPPYQYQMICNSPGWTEGQSCSRSFDAPGTYYLRFHAEDANFTFGLMTNAVNVREPMAVSFSCVSQAEVGKDATCTATVSGGAGPYNYAFNWGDESSGFSFKADSASQGVAHVYERAGTFPVKVTVKDSAGQTATGSASIRIVAGEPLSVVVSCDSQAEVGKDASCTAAVAGGTGPYDYTFEWGDGGKTSVGAVDSTSQSAGHIYAKEGTYPVKVTVKDSKGLSGLGSASISVILVECPPGEKICGAVCAPDSWTCCGSGACPTGYPCCGNGCCNPGAWCVREGFCCLEGNVPCPDGKTCCTSVALCHPDVTACCREGTTPIPGSGGQCRPKTAQGMAVPAAASATGESFMTKNRSTPVIFLETEGEFPFSK